MQSFKKFPSGIVLLQLSWRRISMPMPNTVRGTSSCCCFSLLLPSLDHFPAVPGEHTACQAKFGVVGSLHDLLLCIKWQNGHDRPKDLFLHTRHVVSAVPWKHGSIQKEVSGRACAFCNPQSLRDSTQHYTAAAPGSTATFGTPVEVPAHTTGIQKYRHTASSRRN